MQIDRERFKETLKKKGLKVTNQRIVVLETLAKCDGKHLTAEELYEIVKADYPEIGLATIYRTIQLLQELQLVDSIQLGDGYVRYEIGDFDKKEAHHRHHHLICMGCGKVFAFEEDLLEALEEKIKTTTGFQVRDHEVKLYGYCEDCSNNECGE